MKRASISLAVIAVAAAAGGYFLARALDPVSGPEPSPGGVMQRTAIEMIGQRRPDFTLADAEGAPVSAADFDGRLLLVNFWASWCAPCVEEMPMLSDLQTRWAERDLQVVGVAVDDPQRARDFVTGMNLDYTLLFGEVEPALTSRRYGNDSGMLPYTVLVDRGGTVRWTHLGALVRGDLEARLQELR